MGQIYRHISPSGKSYVGKTKYTWQKRAGNNPLDAYAGSRRFYSAILKYGWENFRHEIVEDNIPDTLLKSRECHWINHFDSANSGYNIYAEDGFFSKEGYVRSFSITKEKLESLYLEEGMSLREIARMFNTAWVDISHFVNLYQIEKHTQGFVSQTQLKRINASWLQNRIEINCENCGDLFLPAKKDIRTCSKSCSARISRVNASHSSEVRLKMSKAKLNNKNSIGNKGGLKTAHNRWHVNRSIIKKDCDYCLSPDGS